MKHYRRVTNANDWTDEQDGSRLLQFGEYACRVHVTPAGRWAYEVTTRGVVIVVNDVGTYEAAMIEVERVVSRLTGQ